jgi:hypothetical protein
LVRTKEKLAALELGGSADHAFEVTSAAVIELRAAALPCPQCAGVYSVLDHRTIGAGIRAVDVKCRQCGVARTLWFRLVVAEPN